MVSHFLHDVEYAGDCFYQCVVETCGEQLGVGDTSDLRLLVAAQVLHDKETRRQIRQLLVTLREVRELADDYPLLRARDTGLSGFRSLAAAVASDGVWASELEVSIVRRLLQPGGVALLTVESPSMRSLTEDLWVEEQLLKALAVTVEARAAVLVHVGEHYVYVSLGSDKLPRVSEFREYLRSFLSEAG